MIIELGDDLPFDVVVSDHRRVVGASLNRSQAAFEHRAYMYLRLSGPGTVAFAVYNTLVPILFLATFGVTERTALVALIFVVVQHPWSPGPARLTGWFSRLRHSCFGPGSIWRLEPSGPVLEPANTRHVVSWVDVKSYTMHQDVLVMDCGRIGYGLTPVAGGLTTGELIDVVFQQTAQAPRELNRLLYLLAYGRLRP